MHTIHIKMVWTLAIGELRPIDLANSIDVSFNKRRPPNKIPNTSANDWIRLDSWGEGIYLTISEWRAIFCATIQIWIMKQRIANVLALSSEVKKEAINKKAAANVWLMTIQVFLFPYLIWENFSRKGAECINNYYPQ